MKQKQLKLIDSEWDSTHIYTKVILKQDTVFKSLEDNKEKFIKKDGDVFVPYKNITIKKGTYFISGFWANMMGLATSYKKCLHGGHEFLIVSSGLKEFYKEI